MHCIAGCTYAFAVCSRVAATYVASSLVIATATVCALGKCGSNNFQPFVVRKHKRTFTFEIVGCLLSKYSSDVNNGSQLELEIGKALWICENSLKLWYAICVYRKRRQKTNAMWVNAASFIFDTSLIATSNAFPYMDSLRTLASFF